MLAKSLVICSACIGLGVVAPAVTPSKGSAAERFMHYGLVPAFLIKLSQEQIRYEALQSSGRLALLAQTTRPVDPDCCNGIPPWHMIGGP